MSGCTNTTDYANATPTEQVEAIKFWYDGWLLDNHPTADSILCQQVGQILGLEVKR